MIAGWPRQFARIVWVPTDTRGSARVRSSRSIETARQIASSCVQRHPDNPVGCLIHPGVVGRSSPNTLRRVRPPPCRFTLPWCGSEESADSDLPNRPVCAVLRRMAVLCGTVSHDAQPPAFWRRKPRWTNRPLWGFLISATSWIAPTGCGKHECAADNHTATLADRSRGGHRLPHHQLALEIGYPYVRDMRIDANQHQRTAAILAGLFQRRSDNAACT